MNRIKPIFGIAVFLGIMYLIWELVPPYFHQYQFQDYVDQHAKEVTYEYNKTEDQVRAEIMKEAREDSIPITPEQIQVTKSPTNCTIAVNYTVHVDLPFFPQDIHFVAASKNASVYSK
ncbi:MAG TPA: hypothetical protein VK657_11380 [Terriglobales bacterium]|nr:hypothetical protein [Terriglobales bacterium]